MEGLLQAFKYEKIEQQVEVCKITGIYAKRKGSKRNKHWKQSQKLHWNGVVYGRKSNEYQILLNRAFNALGTNESFRKDLDSTGTAVFKHSIGRKKKSDTVLTVREFCSRLTKLRDGEHPLNEW